LQQANLGLQVMREVTPGCWRRPGQVMRALYFDRDGLPVSSEAWRRLSRQEGYCQVEYASAVRHGREVTVATFWLGTVGDGTGRQP
jgi:hypothetical protein